MNHDWKTCRCTDCQSIIQEIESARKSGAEFMREEVLTLAQQFKLPAMAITFLRKLPLPEPTFKT